MGQAKGPLTKSQYDQLAKYTGAGIMLLDGGNTSTSSGGSASGSFTGTWTIHWDSGGFTGGNPYNDYTFVGNGYRDYTSEFENGTLEDVIEANPENGYWLANFVGTNYPSGCVTLQQTTT